MRCDEAEAVYTFVRHEMSPGGTAEPRNIDFVDNVLDLIFKVKDSNRILSYVNISQTTKYGNSLLLPTKNWLHVAFRFVFAFDLDPF